MKTTKLNYFLALILFLATFDQTKAQSKRKIEKIFKASEIVNNHYTGFALYDPVKDKMVYELDANKPAIPASNTKIITLYTALNMLGDSIPGLRYVTKGDSLIFWGTGDPSMMHPDLKSTKVYDFLKNSNKKLFYSHSNASTDFVGSAIYTIAMVSLPIGENTAQAYAGPDGKVRLKPEFLNNYLKEDTSYHPRSFTVRRDERTNTFSYPSMAVPAGFKQTVYLVPGAGLTQQTLSEVLGKPVNVTNMALPESAKTLYSIPSDSLYKRMMLPSDNYLAEQILYLCSSTLPGKLSVEAAIAHSLKNYLTDLPDLFQWRDGSGLSRNNYFSPRSIVKMLIKVRDKVGNEQRLLNMFPVGGVSGTLRTAFKTDNGVPFVWAKTGTLSNVRIQGGYIVTRKGKKFIYSFMNNNFLIPSADISNEMVRIMTMIHEKY
ncbi:D-alanyl-D-alanine carboxypeptidase [Daejeonella lutea]|uniref:D-alanyl-D-alanine carboxypeptidase / D-alanyl-D-alanine-endopeptidase (Penicillin-binding protein 4) n=1 Tax=Daejeonella lutea TaxID=572036 RepID=A0A1T5B970_9SPHI|nr:D-alanyl-D-alanine carboxypeptidase [Daejeonella lutea]SKB43579.1 D-alanyl-D-alanine carboxypeptidase / D-alanyl-D-alanine-endopeptidase (penicillin-binding protein 4) [Daejeonella lutea]